MKASSLFFFLCWFIWKARNEFIFHGLSPSASSVIPKAVAASIEFGLASRKVFQSILDVPSPSPSRWSAPFPGSVKINCDGAFVVNIQMGSAAYVVKDHMGSLIGG